MITIKKKLNGKSHMGIYFETWNSKFTNNHLEHDLLNIKEPYNVCYICFVHPLCKYSTRSYDFRETGLDFSSEFKTIKYAIKIMREINIIVMLSVGGSDYSFRTFNAKNIASLCSDLGCDGIDIHLGQILLKDKVCNVSSMIHEMRKYLRYKFISLTIFQNLTSDNITRALTNNGFQLDWLNINNSNKDVTGVDSFYKNFFKGYITDINNIVKYSYSI